MGPSSSEISNGRVLVVPAELLHRQGHFQGFTGDDETGVGRDHLGIVHLFDMERSAVLARESEIADGRSRPVQEITPLSTTSRCGRRFACGRFLGGGEG